MVVEQYKNKWFVLELEAYRIGCRIKDKTTESGSGSITTYHVYLSLTLYISWCVLFCLLWIVYSLLALITDCCRLGRLSNQSHWCGGIWEAEQSKLKHNRFNKYLINSFHNLLNCYRSCHSCFSVQNISWWNLLICFNR